MKLVAVVVVVVAALLGAGCGSEPEALLIALDVQEGEALDTSDVTGLLVLIGEDERAVEALRTDKVSIELQTPPAGPTDVVVFGCKGAAACRQGPAAAFIGCQLNQDLRPSDEPLKLLVLLFDALDTPPEECAPFIEPAG